MKTKSALSWFGSDSEVAADLAALLDHCNHVTIPFCGGLSILPHLKARAIVANDLNSHAINFYRILNSNDQRSAELIHRCEKTLSHPQELHTAAAFLCTTEYHWRIDRAWAYWAACWIGRKGKGGTKHIGGMPSIRRTANGGTNASRIRSAAEDLHAWAKEFERCEFENRDYLAVLDDCEDVVKCGIYCDPPFVKAGRNYLHSFTAADHEALRLALGRFDNAKVVVRYDDSPLVRELYADWSIIESASRTQANTTKGELWITKN